MQLKHIKTLLPAQEGAAKICSMCWSMNSKKFAVCTYDRVILLFDEFGEMKDKFNTRPCDPKFGKKSYVIKSIAFSPDATKIAVGQTDDILYVYKIGDDWGETKSICNKFIHKGAVTCVAWLPENQLIYGTAEGKVRLANTRSNKSSTLYDAKSYVLSIAVNPSGKGILSGHADGSIIKFMATDDGAGDSSGKVCSHPSPPYALAWGSNSFLVGGCDRRVFAYTKEGRMLQQFDYNKDRDCDEKEFSCAVCSPSGQSVVIGSYDRLRIYNWSPRKGLWDEGMRKDITNLYTITSMAWKMDGSQVYVGSLCGTVEIFDCCLKKSIYKNTIEISHVGISQIMVKNLIGSKSSMSLKSRDGSEVTEVKVMGGGRYVLAHTTDTLILADIERKASCEVVPWTATGGHEKYSFDYDNVCLIFNAGELNIVEYGRDEVLGSVRTEFTNKHLISVRINERKSNDSRQNKRLAYLIDLKTIAIIDLVSGSTLGTVSHDLKVGWLELNETGHKLLFRDKKLKLHLYDVGSKSKTTILNYCSYVQWVPGSDVVVAQNRNNLCVWYNIEAPDKVTNISIKGDVTDIERVEHVTNVLVSDGGSAVKRYKLDESLIEFRTAIDDDDLARAILYLESLDMTSETEAMWQKLAAVSMETNQLNVAQRCYAALGDIARVRHLDEISNILRDEAVSYCGHSIEGMEYYKVKAELAIMQKNFKLAEHIYLDQNMVDEAMRMYQDMHKWEDAIYVAELKNHPDIEMLKKKYYLWLMETRQESKAGDMKEAEGNYETAVQLFIKAGLPAKAARLVTSRSDLLNNPQLVSTVLSALIKSEMHDRAGDLCEQLGRSQEAIELYKKGGCFRKAVELTRETNPQMVVKLEEEWGNYLVSQKQYDAAINHFIEAGCTMKAVDAAINSRQWVKALEILDVVEDKPEAKKYYLKIAQHYVQAAEYEVAERCFTSAGCMKEAIDMYNNAGKWEMAHKLVSQTMDQDQGHQMSLMQAKQLEEKGKFREAERLYIAIECTDDAISMYKRHKMYDDMIRMVRQHRPNHLKDTHLYLAKILESENRLKLAEHHLIEAREIDLAVQLYSKNNQYEEAYRIAKGHGGVVTQQKVAYDWSKWLGGDSAVKLLVKLNMFEAVIDYAVKSSPPDFELAFDLARGSKTSKSQQDMLAFVSEKYAEHLEEAGRFKEAEAQFIKAGIPKSAVLMYVSLKDWDSAQRVAELYDRSSLNDVMTAQGHVAFENKEYQKAESFFLRAQRPNIIIQCYKEQNMWADALRVCKEYLPAMLDDLQSEYETKAIETTIQKAQDFETKGEYARAVKCYVEVTSQNEDDVTIVEKCYRKASQLALKFLSQENATRVVEVVGPRLVEMKRCNAAAELYLQADLIREAVDAFMTGEEWNKARKVATELEPRLLPHVEERYKNYLKDKDKLDTLENVDTEAAIERYITKGDWMKAINLAEKKNPKMLPKYVAQYATVLIKENKTKNALTLYEKYGTPAIPQNFNIYKRIFYDMVNLPKTNNSESFQMWSQLRNMFYNLKKNLDQSKNAESDEFYNMFLAAHYYATRSACINHDSLAQLTCKLSTSLLRHSDLVPADKAFYEAGVASKNVGNDSAALAFFNRFLDMVEAIEDQSLDALDHSIFSDTDIPSEIPLPERPYVSSAEHEEVREWVLAISMDQKVNMDLPRDENGVYVGSLINHPDAQDTAGRLPACVLTGFSMNHHSIKMIF
ncbi:hypothetical protein HELRODRAFT_74793 [Helobdella robusta]|uniref:Intraflagellar transport protein 172 homolog n=1 Tax=Helobdella robusta TaxID=6412 RepID=T1G1V8_HELRO|nr:hypothetical protein HELRODRAFT_74793 [Helobdella robusta]ESO08535.1 hypothetical protein HELRODRAFT_74793 [Helobdella robusta]